MKKKTVVLGLGNPLMADEGVGTYLIEHLLVRADKFPDVDFIDAGTGGMSILHLIEGRSKAIIIDCAYMGEKPGTIRKFSPDEITSVKKLAHQSLHEADIVKIIALAKQLDQCPQEIVIFGIEPEILKLHPKLSETLATRTDEYMSSITEELA